MSITKRGNESVLNIVGSFTGLTWRLFQDWALEDLEKTDAFPKIIEVLDRNFAYDDRVQLPADFESYFNLLQRQGGQTLLMFINDHEEAYRKLQQHKVELPASVQGWHLLRRAGLSREQRQLITLKAPTMEKNEVIEALYLILGQDYKGGGWNVERNRRFGIQSHSWKNHRAYVADDYDDETYQDDEQWEHGYYEEDDSWLEEGPAYEAYDDEGQDFDYDAGYYGEEEPWPDNEEANSPSQMAAAYDSAFASYTDARRRFQELKTSRGYLPIVALTDSGGAPTSTATGSGSPSSWRTKGKGKGSSKGGKSKSVSRPPPDPRGRAKANMNCLRCGQAGHWAANCPQSSSPTSRTPAVKRPASTTEAMAMSTPLDERALLIFQDSGGAERPDCVMLDPGASAFLSGYGPFRRYLDHLRALEFPVDTIKMSKGRRRFQFGGDASMRSDWSAHVPTFVDGKYGTIELFLLPGNTPMLCGRPIIEALGMTMDFAQKRLRIGSSPWMPATLGRQGEYLWSLTNEFLSVNYDPEWPEFVLRTNDQGIEQNDGYRLQDFMTAEHGFTTFEHIDETNDTKTRPLRKQELKTMDVHLSTQLNDLSAYITRELHQPERPRILWEVYCGKARTAQMAETMGMETRCFFYESGWDFERLDHQEEFLRLLDEENRDELLMAPECKLWSKMQSLGRRTPAQKEALRAARHHHHDRHLMFVRRGYLAQVSGGRHATIEQPKNALSWQTRALRDLPGRRTDFSQCRYGAQCLDNDGIWKPVQKNTSLLTTKQSVQGALHLQCQHDHEHCPLEGSAPGYGSRTRYLEEYQPALAAALAAALAVDEPPTYWETGHAAEDERETTSSLIKLRSETKQDAIRTVQRLHRNLGHPAPSALVELLEARGASDAILQAAKTYRCFACAKYKKPAQAAPAAMPKNTQFNEVLQADVMWLRRGSQKYAVMSMVDSATRFTAAVLVNSEHTENYIKALERAWIAHYGAPGSLLTDEGRGWLSAQMDEWTSAHNINHIVAPGEAHERLALVERRHAVIRKSVEVYLDDMKVDGPAGIQEALCYIIPQLNSTPGVAGFSPAQWVLGHQPRLAGDLLSDSTQPVHFGGNQTFEEMLSKRHAARKALNDADADRRLRRALNLKYKGTNSEYALGQQVWFWRDARQPDLVKIRWLGPAQVVMKERRPGADEAEGPVSVYWLAFKSQLIRCAPHHVRADVKSFNHAIDDTQLALNTVRQLKSRGVTRFYDLNRVNRQNLADVEEDEHGQGSSIESGSEHEMTPPRQRPRLMLDSQPTVTTNSAEAAPQIEATTPPTVTTNSAEAASSQAVAPAAQEQGPETEAPMSPPPVPGDTDGWSEPSQEPSEEPPIRTTRPPTPSAQPRPTLDPATAELYESAPAETFQQQRLRFNRQETLSFAPFRHRRTHGANPYPDSTAAADQPATPQQPPEQLAGQGFYLENLDTTSLPHGWHMDEQGYLQLDDRVTDYWELKAGCLIRHHLIPRRGRMHIDQLPKDCPVSAEQLDKLKITLVHQHDGRSRLHTDDGTVTTPPEGTTGTWTGTTVFQLSGETRKEMAMYTGTHLVRNSARQVAKEQKKVHTKKVKKDKGGVNERLLGPHERALFKEAKVKELRSFFDHGVWAFQTTADADEARTLTSRILLKWSKNEDGSPRAKARLIVRGFNDPDALSGAITTSSPTTTRLSRSMVLSLAANMHWPTWTADVSTAFLQGRPQTRKLWVKLPAEALQLLGASEDTRMLLLKPCYGQTDAPRGWYLEAVDRLLRAGLRQRPLDPCAFLIYEKDDPDYDEHNPIHQETATLGTEKLCGMVIMHVDDMLGAGCPRSPRYKAVTDMLRANFSFREWKEDLPKLEYCGCELEKTEEGGRRLHQENYYAKVKPITLQKGRDLHDRLSEKEVTQVRGLLGSLQWPAVQTAPHLQCSTSMLSGQITKATVNTVQECNKLLRFAKEHNDVSLYYNPIGHPSELQLLCFFDAGFTARSDGSSQGGYILMFVNRQLLTSGEDGEYHVLDWRSFRTPRVTRSSLAAEAQAGGQAVDSIDFTCRYWHYIMNPDLKLKDLLKASSTLTPIMVTDAKALYDSYHREGVSSSVVDKRVSLEIRVMKEMLEELNGQLRWMSSERQIADGLTKESARVLLAARLRHRRVKLTWDPNYVASKKKTKNEKAKAIAETTLDFQPEHYEPEENQDPVEEHTPPNADVSEYPEILEDDGMPPNEEIPATAYFSKTMEAVAYVYAMSHGGCPMKYVKKSRKPNALWLMLLLSMLVLTKGQQCEKGQDPENQEEGHLLMWLAVLALLHVTIMAGVFFAGRWSCHKDTKDKPLMKEVQVQKDEPIVHTRLRDLLQQEKTRSEEALRAARESRSAFNNLISRSIWEMDHHTSMCPFSRPIVTNRTATCWHHETCHMVEQMNEPLLIRRACAYCAMHRPPPDRTDAQARTIRTDLTAWLTNAALWLPTEA